MELQNNSSDSKRIVKGTPWREVRQTAESILGITGDKYYGKLDEKKLFKGLQVVEQYFGQSLKALNFYEINKTVDAIGFDEDEDYDSLITDYERGSLYPGMVYFISYANLTKIPKYLHPIVESWMYEYAKDLYQDITSYKHRFFEKEEVLHNMKEWAEGDEEEYNKNVADFEAMLEWREKFKKNYNENWRDIKVKFKSVKDKKFIAALKKMPMSIHVEHAGYNDGVPFESIFFFTYSEIEQCRYGFATDFIYEHDYINMEIDIMNNSGVAEARVFHNFDEYGNYLHSTDQSEFDKIKAFIKGLDAYSSYVYKWKNKN